jgi:hypothetical protein
MLVIAVSCVIADLGGTTTRTKLAIEDEAAALDAECGIDREDAPS